MNGYRTLRTGPVTLEQYVRTPDPDERLEVVRGRMIREPRPGNEHGKVQACIATLLVPYVRERKLGDVLTDAGFVLATDPLTVRAPDVAFVARGRYPDDRLPTGLAHLAPDLAVEIVSPNDRAADVQEKVDAYLESGTRLVWVVYPRTRQVVVFHASEDVRVIPADGEVDGGDVLEGFRATVGQLLGD
ncbi:MAG: Uma2 family endonuclease [Longimicrobiales bacterium]